MAIWTSEIKELERLYESFKGQLPELEKELGLLIRTEDPNVILLYSRRCLEVIITDLCECVLKRERGSEPLKGIIDKLNKEKKIPAHIASSMYGLNEISTYGTHPKDFDPEQVKPVLINLDIIIKWYLKYKGLREETTIQTTEETLYESKTFSERRKSTLIQRNKVSLMLSAIILILIILFAVLYFTDTISGGKKTKGLEKSIAILPFRNDTPVDSNKYFINGVMEDILNDLQKIKDLRVISRTSVEQYRNTAKPIPLIARELHVNYIVEGSGQKSGNTFRLTTQLLRAKNENHLWGKTYEQELRDAKDLFKIQSQIAESIAGELEAAITPQERRLIEKTPTSSLAAYENCIIGGSYLIRYTKEDCDIALQYFEKAKEIDPDYVGAYLGIIHVWLQRAQFSWVTPGEAYPIAKGNLDKAISLDSTSSEIYATIAETQIYIDWDFKGAEASIKKCISLNPNDVVGNMHYGALLMISGRSKESIKQHELTLRLDPLNTALKTDYGLSLYSAGRSNDAIEVFQEVLKADPDNMVALGNLPLALHAAGKYSKELEIWKLYFTTVFKDFANVFDQGYINGGIIGALNLQGDSLVEQSKTKFIQPTEIALIYGCAGNKERTLDMLERCYEVHDSNLPFYLKSPVYEFIHNEPRYQNLLQKMNLPYKP